MSDFAKTDAHRKIYKHDFRSLYDSLLGKSFSKTLETIPYDKTILQLERDADSAMPQIPVLTSTPVKNENDFEPNFKNEYSKFRKMHENSEEEIRYRDTIISDLERKELKSRDKDSHIKTLNKKLENLEEEVLYRDRIIIEKENDIKLKDEKLKRLQDRLKLTDEELRLYRDGNTDKAAMKHSEFFNKALMERVKEQQRAIDSLKTALAQKSDIVASSPVIIPDYSTRTSHKDALYSWRNIIYSIFILILLYIIFKPTSHSKMEPWYTNTFMEPFMFHLFEDRDIDYDYYNLGDVKYDYLQT